MTPIRVTVLVGVERPEPAGRVMAALKDVSYRLPPQVAGVAVEVYPFGEVLDRLLDLYAGPPAGVVLVSDRLIREDPPGTFRRSPEADALFEQVEKKGIDLFATIALYPEPARVRDVDRVLRADWSPADLVAGIERCLDRLDYLRRPAPQFPHTPVEIRRIRYENEMRSYFALRYRVYRAMCYLHPRVEDNPAELEVDWFDLKSLHLGAFVRRNGYEELVGAARLITNAVLDPEQAEVVQQIVDTDPYLQLLVDPEAIQAQLPVFQSQQLIDLMTRAADDDAVVGEVSRVVVDRDHRGSGLSTALVSDLIGAATRHQVSDLLLECLPVHARVYEGHGFQLLSGVSGTVYVIGRTMIVMHRPLLEERSIFRPRAGAAAAVGLAGASPAEMGDV
jgi:predicted GNAT family N-acyltransferase